MRGAGLGVRTEALTWNYRKATQRFVGVQGAWERLLKPEDSKGLRADGTGDWCSFSGRIAVSLIAAELVGCRKCAGRRAQNLKYEHTLPHFRNGQALKGAMLAAVILSGALGRMARRVSASYLGPAIPRTSAEVTARPANWGVRASCSART